MARKQKPVYIETAEQVAEDDAEAHVAPPQEPDEPLTQTLAPLPAEIEPLDAPLAPAEEAEAVKLFASRLDRYDDANLRGRRAEALHNAKIARTDAEARRWRRDAAQCEALLQFRERRRLVEWQAQLDRALRYGVEAVGRADRQCSHPDGSHPSFGDALLGEALKPLQVLLRRVPHQPALTDGARAAADELLAALTACRLLSKRIRDELVAALRGFVANPARNSVAMHAVVDAAVACMRHDLFVDGLSKGVVQ
jgi:hypothetical protein